MNKQVICDIDGQFFSMDSMCVRSIENGKAEMVLGGAPDFVEGIRKFRGEWVPIVRLRTLLGIDRSEEPVLSQLIYLRTENGTMAFRVDKVAFALGAVRKFDFHIRTADTDTISHTFGNNVIFISFNIK